MPDASLDVLPRSLRGVMLVAERLEIVERVESAVALPDDVIDVRRSTSADARPFRPLARRLMT
jgi:hypothetical protein